MAALSGWGMFVGGSIMVQEISQLFPITSDVATALLSHALTLTLLIGLLTGTLGFMATGRYADPSSDIDYLFPSPVTPRQVFIAERLLVFVILDLYFAIMLFGGSLGVAQGLGVPIWRALLCFLTLFACVDTMWALSYLGLFITASVENRRRVGLLVRGSILIVAVVLIAAVASVAFPADLSFVQLEPISQLLSRAEALFPSGLAASAAVGFLLRSGVPSWSYMALGFLMAEVLLINLVTMRLSEYYYYERVSEVAEEVEARKRGVPLSMPRLRVPTLPAIFAGGGGSAFVYNKDRALIARHSFYRGMLLLDLVVSALATLAVIAVHPAMRSVPVFSFVALTYVLMAITSLFGVEGKSFDYLKSAPVKEAEVVRAKFTLALPYVYVAMLPLLVAPFAANEYWQLLPVAMFLPPVICSAALLAGIIQPFRPTQMGGGAGLESLFSLVVLGFLGGIAGGPLFAMSIFIPGYYAYVASTPYALAVTWVLLRTATVRLRGLEEIH